MRLFKTVIMLRRFVRAIGRLLTKIFEYPVKLFELKKISHYAAQATKYHPIFIVGAPRTGSTILYQVLTKYFDLLYINNLIDLFHRNLYFGFWLSFKLFGKRRHDSFRSNFGNTLIDGLNAPSESGVFWWRWFPKDRDYVTANDIQKKDLLEIESNINAVTNHYEKPLLLKNLSISQRLEVIAKVFPSAKLIFIKRNPVFTAQSILESRRGLGVKANQWWSVRPKNFMELSKLDEIKRIVKQIFFTEKQIIEDMKLFPDENVMTVSYEEFCADFTTILSKLGDFMGKDLKTFQHEKSFIPQCTNQQRLPDETFERIRQVVQTLDWIHYRAEDEVDKHL